MRSLCNIFYINILYKCMNKCQWFDNNANIVSNTLWKPTETIAYDDFYYKFKTTNQFSFLAETNVDDINDNITYKPIKQKNIDNVIKTTKIRIYFNEDQCKIIDSWVIECKKVYDKCVELCNSVEADKRYLYSYGLLKKKVFGLLYGEDKNTRDKKGAPYDMLTDEVISFCSAYRAAITNTKNGNIAFFAMKEKKCNNMCSISIPRRSITINGIFPTLLNKSQKDHNKDHIEDHNKEQKKYKNFKYIMKKNKINLDTVRTSRLLIDKVRNKYYLCLVRQFETKNIIVNNNKHNIVAIDPGEKIPFCLYSENHYAIIGESMRKQILDQQDKIKKNQKILSDNKNKEGNKLNNKCNIKKRIIKSYKKITNIVKEFHNKTVNFLCHNYNQILLPKFETSKMLKNTKNMDKKEKRRQKKLFKRTKFVLQSLSFYKFKERLTNKCNEMNCKLDIVTEEYTSQCCTNCGVLSNKYDKNRTKTCINCNYKIDRDINGSRNILIKNHDYYVKGICIVKNVREDR